MKLEEMRKIAEARSKDRFWDGHIYEQNGKYAAYSFATSPWYNFMVWKEGTLDEEEGVGELDWEKQNKLKTQVRADGKFISLAAKNIDKLLAVVDAAWKVVLDHKCANANMSLRESLLRLEDD